MLSKLVAFCFVSYAGAAQPTCGNVKSLFEDSSCCNSTDLTNLNTASTPPSENQNPLIRDLMTHMGPKFGPVDTDFANTNDRTVHCYNLKITNDYTPIFSDPKNLFTLFRDLEPLLRGIAVGTGVFLPFLYDMLGQDPKCWPGYDGISGTGSICLDGSLTADNPDRVPGSFLDNHCRSKTLENHPNKTSPVWVGVSDEYPTGLKMVPNPMVPPNQVDRQCASFAELPGGSDHPYASFLSWLFLTEATDTNKNLDQEYEKYVAINAFMPGLAGVPPKYDTGKAGLAAFIEHMKFCLSDLDRTTGWASLMNGEMMHVPCYPLAHKKIAEGVKTGAISLDLGLNAPNLEGLTEQVFETFMTMQTFMSDLTYDMYPKTSLKGWADSFCRGTEQGDYSNDMGRVEPTVELMFQNSDNSRDFDSTGALKFMPAGELQDWYDTVQGKVYFGRRAHTLIPRQNMYNDFKGSVAYEMKNAMMMGFMDSDYSNKSAVIAAYAPTHLELMSNLAKHAAEQFETGTPMDIRDMVLKLVTIDKWMDQLTFYGNATHPAGIRDPNLVACNTCNMNFGRFIRTFETLERYFAPVYVEDDGTPTPLILKARLEFSKAYSSGNTRVQNLPSLSSAMKMNVFADPPGGLKTFAEIGLNYSDIFSGASASVPLYNENTCTVGTGTQQFYPCYKHDTILTNSTA